jgi:hypothetical protein
MIAALKRGDISILDRLREKHHPSSEQFVKKREVKYQLKTSTDEDQNTLIEELRIDID